MTLKKKLAVGVGALLGVVVIALVVAVIAIDGIARAGIEKGGSFALGTKTTLKSASIGLFSGRFGLEQLSVANPAGFKKPEFLALGKGDVAVTLGSLLKDTIEVPSFSLSTIRVSLEKSSGKTNYGVLLDNLKKATGGDSTATPAPKPKDAGGGKKFIVREIIIRDVNIHVDLLGTGSAADSITSLNVPIAEIRLTDVGNAKDGGVDLATLSSVIVNAVLQAAASAGKGVLPDDLLGDLNGQLAGLTSQLSKIDGLGDTGVSVAAQLGKGAEQVAGKLGGELQKVISSQSMKAAGAGVESAAKDVGKAAEGAAKDVGDALKGILPGKPKEEKKGTPK